MYILAYDLVRKITMNTYLKQEIHVVCREFLAFKRTLLSFLHKKL